MARGNGAGRRIRSALFALLLSWMPVSSIAGEPPSSRQSVDACDMAVDTVICRPAGLLATLLGTTIWAVSLPFSLVGGNEEEARKKLIYEPAAYTFKRPLGSRECSCNDFQDP